MPDLPNKRRHYYEVTLDAGNGVIYTGKGATETAARTAAKGLARKRGGFSTSTIKAMPELELKSLVGPKGRTFTSNARTPE